MPVQPFDRRNADGVGKTEELLARRADERDVGNALQPGVLGRRHPTRPNVAVFDLDHDLPSAAAARRAQTSGQAVEADLESLLAVANSAKRRADERLFSLS